MMDQELRLLKEAVEVSPENVSLRLYYLKKLVATASEEQKEEVLKECQRLLTQAPSSKEAWLEVAEVYHNYEEYEEAISCCKKLLSMENLSKKERGKAHDLLALCYIALDNQDEALKAWEISKQLNPEAEENGETIKREEQDENSANLLLRSGYAETTVTAIPFERSEVTFADVGGLSHLKEQLRLKIIFPFQEPDLYKIYGKKAGGGILLYGPPGCGKTLIARAVAGECKAGFISIGISDILDMWHGNTEKNIKAIFEKARACAPCIIFFDEIEAIGGNRKEMEQHFQRIITDELLLQMDGVGSKNENVLVIGATNSPWNIDNALKRPGRFDRILFVPPPDLKAREEILRIYLKDKPVENINIQKIASRTEFFSGADLKNLVDMASEQVLTKVMQEKRIIKIKTEDLLSCLKDLRPSTLEWLQTAKNYATYANQSGFYDEVNRYLKENPGLKIA